MKKSMAVLVAAGVAGASLMSAPAAQAKTVKACVKKSNGSVKIINKKFKKCKKGWVKTSWNSEGVPGAAGTPGATGPAGPNWTVKDVNGVTLGVFSGYYSNGLEGSIMVTAADGGLFRYYIDGELNNDNSDLYFVNNGCTDAAWFGATNLGLQTALKSAGSSARAVFHVTDAPTASAWTVAKTTTTTVPIGANMLFEKDSTTGACSAATHVAGFYIPLTPAPAPVVAARGGLQVVQ